MVTAAEFNAPEEPLSPRFATPAEWEVRKARIERALDIVNDSARATKELGPRDRKPHEDPETVPSCSAILIALAINELTETIKAHTEAVRTRGVPQ